MSQQDVKNSSRELKIAKQIHAPDPSELSRRSFLGRSSLGAIAVTVVPTTASLALPSVAVAQAFSGLGESVGSTLLRMARDIYPHDRLPDKLYLDVVGPYDAKANRDSAFKAMIIQGVSGLNGASLRRFTKRYAELASEGERTELLYAIEETRFFQTVRTDLINQLYNSKSVWPSFGYEGPSWMKEGYLNRGFDEINWL